MITSLLLALFLNVQTPKTDLIIHSTNSGIATITSKDENITIYVGPLGYKGTIYFSDYNSVNKCTMTNIVKIMKLNKELLETNDKENQTPTISGSNAVFDPCAFSNSKYCQVQRGEAQLAILKEEAALESKKFQILNDLRIETEICKFMTEVK